MSLFSNIHTMKPQYFFLDFCIATTSIGWLFQISRIVCAWESLTGLPEQILIFHIIIVWSWDLGTTLQSGAFFLIYYR